MGEIIVKKSIPALRAKGLHRGELNTRARSALVVKGGAGEWSWMMRWRRWRIMDFFINSNARGAELNARVRSALVTRAGGRELF